MNTHIKPASKKEQAKITSAVRKVIENKKQNPQADTTALENQIGQLVYQLYDLTEEEIKIVENG